MKPVTKTCSLMFMAAMLAGCDTTTTSTPETEMTQETTSTVSGTALYRERIALPPGAAFEATLEDVSLADAPAKVLGRVGFEAPSGPPIAFEISYDAADIEPRHRYAVRARIEHEGRLMFTTDTHYPVLTQGAPDTVEMLLVRVATPPPSNASLENTYWKVMSIRGEPVTVAERQREPHLILHPDDQRVSGHGGCNSMMGGYEVNGDQLTFKQMAGTMMACPEGMEQEQALHQALGEVILWQVAGEQLQLRDGDDVVVLELESRYME
ncbi:YbaY family lipoprotein [Marinihelvus fidelis]|nr:YbaY family lipoprotein [Marinihelvus fidelis]